MSDRSISSGPRAVVGRVTLPVSGLEVNLLEASGRDEVLVAEWSDTDLELSCALARSLSTVGEAGAADWGALSITDLDALVLSLRQALVGERVRADIVCPVPGCGQRIDIEFSVAEYFSHVDQSRHHVRVRGRSVVAAEESGWYRLVSAKRAATPSGGEPGGVSFRLPSVRDLIEVSGSEDPEAELVRRCVRPKPTDSRERRKVEAAMERLAPEFARDLDAQCPGCGSTVELHFDPRDFCLQELRQRAAFVYEEVDLLARRYHWTESEILSLPRSRRSNYVNLARQQVCD